MPGWPLLWRRRDVHRRGALIVGGLSRRRREALPTGLVTLAGVPIPSGDETKHFKLIGTTGTGKSTAIRELLAQALRRGDRAVISDPDGGYLSQFLHAYRGDVILNPFERDSLRWDPFAELHDQL